MIYGSVCEMPSVMTGYNPYKYKLAVALVNYSAAICPVMDEILVECGIIPDDIACRRCAICCFHKCSVPTARFLLWLIFFLPISNPYGINFQQYKVIVRTTTVLLTIATDCVYSCGKWMVDKVPMAMIFPCKVGIKYRIWTQTRGLDNTATKVCAMILSIDSDVDIDNYDATKAVAVNYVELSPTGIPTIQPEMKMFVLIK